MRRRFVQRNQNAFKHVMRVHFQNLWIEEVDDEDDDKEDEQLEEGDHVFMTVLEPEAEHV
jgi:Ran GTPase-activating protein (RanGAP) involved in mRNA processing and transport